VETARVLFSFISGYLSKGLRRLFCGGDGAFFAAGTPGIYQKGLRVDKNVIKLIKWPVGGMI